MIFLWILLGVGIYYLFIKKENIGFGLNNQQNEAEKVLQLRFVNGEITQEEYEKMKKIIKS